MIQNIHCWLNPFANWKFHTIHTKRKTNTNEKIKTKMTQGFCGPLLWGLNCDSFLIHEEHESLKGKLSVFRKELWQIRAGEPTDANGFDLGDLTARDWQALNHSFPWESGIYQRMQCVFWVHPFGIAEVLGQWHPFLLAPRDLFSLFLTFFSPLRL